MSIELFFGAVILLALFAAFDLMVGVSNDAVNFLNSAIGSRVATRRTIMIVASLGIMAGVTFSSGMMEVARKGIFHPQFFTMPELMVMFLGVMLADVILLDVFNSYGIPTSTTVSIVFELLGAAVAVSAIKLLAAGGGLSDLSGYINTSRAMVIILGILLSVAVSFAAGALAQFLSRLLFTFDYAKTLPRYGALWGGMALSMITYFILVKGAKGSSLIPAAAAPWVSSHGIPLVIFPVSAVVLQGLMLAGMNVFKPIVLFGTFALAMAFSANDLVNFIGVPMAGWHAYQAAAASSSPMDITMDALRSKMPAESAYLIIAGLIMVVTLWVSKKARTVTATEIGLSRQNEGEERFESSYLSRKIVKLARGALDAAERVVPGPLRRWASGRLDHSRSPGSDDPEARPPFDLLRASVNLMTASAVISYATAYKLPLSTTYVTFMVAMGSSFADRAWGRESAVYRVTGVLTVIGSWFFTAFAAFTTAALFAVIASYGGVLGVCLLLGVVCLAVWKNHHIHVRRTQAAAAEQVFNLRKVKDVAEAKRSTFEHMGALLQELRESLRITLDALIRQKEEALYAERLRSKRVQLWVNIITANVFKTMRLMQKKDGVHTYMYGQTTRRLQKLADGHRDIVLRSYWHVSNQHKGLLHEQVDDIRQVGALLDRILAEAGQVVTLGSEADAEKLLADDARLREFAGVLHERQIRRIHGEESKTRLSILFYAIVGNAMNVSKQCLKLIEISKESLQGSGLPADFD